MPVQFNHLHGPLCGNGFKIGRYFLVCRIGDQSGKDISLEIIIFAVCSFEHHLLAGQFSSGFHIVVHLIIQAAFQFGTHTRQFLRIERDVLKASGTGAHRHEVLHPGGTTEFTSTGSGTANTPCFLARANLFHLNTHMKGVCQHLDQLSEIHTLVGNIIEYGLVAVALIFHITDFHLQIKVLGYLTTLDHGVMLSRFGLIILVHIHGFGNTVNAFDVVSRLEVGLLDLQFHQSSRERHHTDVMSGIGFHGNDVAFFQFQSVHVMVIALTGVFKLHLHQVSALCIARHISQPVERVELTVLPTASSDTQTTVAVPAYGEFFVFEIHFTLYHYYFLISDTMICVAKSKNTILGLAFCPISLIARCSREVISMTFASLMKRAKLRAKFSSSLVI